MGKKDEEYERGEKGEGKVKEEERQSELIDNSNEA